MASRLSNVCRKVRRYPFKTGPFHSGQLEPSIKIIHVQMSLWVLARKDPLGTLPRIQAFENCDTRLSQRNILNSPAFGFSKRKEAMFDVYIGPLRRNCSDVRIPVNMANRTHRA